MVKIFYSDIYNCDYNKVKIENFCKLRKEYINSINDEKRKCQSVFAWQLLIYALKSEGVYGSFLVDNFGKWSLFDNQYNFSIAHSNNIVAVAIGDCNILGIDVEECSEKVLKLNKKISKLMDNDLSEIDFFTREWTRYESSIKAGNKANFIDKKIVDELLNQYYLTICTNEKVEKFNYVNANKLLF